MNLWSQAKGVGRVNLEIMINIYTLPLIAQSVKRLPEVQETWIQFLDWKDPLEKEMATHSSIRAWRIPWTEESGGLQSMGSKRVRHDLATEPPPHYHTTTLECKLFEKKTNCVFPVLIKCQSCSKNVSICGINQWSYQFCICEPC